MSKHLPCEGGRRAVERSKKIIIIIIISQFPGRINSMYKDQQVERSLEFSRNMRRSEGMSGMG